MSTITRAFTTRRIKHSFDLRDPTDGSFPHRSNTTKAAASIRHKISAPVELIHTTNMLSYNAPDIYPKPGDAALSAKSDDDSDSAPTTASTPPTSPDSPFPDHRPMSPEPNHLSCYFPGQKATATAPAMASAAPEAPVIPQRAPSHTKKSYEGLVRHRSASRLSEQSTRSLSTKASFSFSRSSSSSTSTSTTSVSHSSMSHVAKPAPAPVGAPLPPAPSAPPVTQFHKKEYSDSHPFGHELAQVSELAEEYGVKDGLSAMAEEEQELLRKGLYKFTADDYLRDLRGIATSIFAEARPLAAVWI